MKILKQYTTRQYSITVKKVKNHTEEIIDTKKKKPDPVKNMHKKHDDKNAIYEKKDVNSGITGLSFGVTVSKGK